MKTVYFLKTQSQTYAYRLKQAKPQFWYSQSYTAPWVLTPENILAQYSWQEGKMILTNKRIYVRFKNKTLMIEKPQKATIKHVRLHAPILAGGIFAPFAVLAAGRGILGIWMAALIAVVGAALFYYGYKGVYSIEIQGDKESKKFFVDEADSGLTDFLGWLSQNPPS